jgi:hypothetical protein
MYCYSCAANGGKKNGVYTPLRLVQVCEPEAESRVKALLWIESKFGLDVLPDEPGEPLPEEATLPKTWIIAGMNELAEACIEYFRSKGEGTKAAYKYLAERHISPAISAIVPIGVLPPDLDMSKIVGLVDDAFWKGRAIELCESKEDINACKNDKAQGEAAAYWERRFRAEDKAVDEYKKKLLEIHKYDYMIAAFREDRYDNYISVEFRPGKRDDNGKTRVYTIRPGRQGLFGLRIAGFGVSEKRDSLLCVEGWMNLLRLWSEQAIEAYKRGMKKNWEEALFDAVSLGSAADWDEKNLSAVLDEYELTPVVMYDKGEKSSLEATRRLLENRSLVAFKVPDGGDDFETAKDLDEVFDIIDSNDVVEWLKKNADYEPNFHPRPWKSVHKEIEKIRKSSAKGFEITEDVTNVVQKDLGERGAYHNGENIAGYVWLHKEHKLVRIDDEEDDFLKLMDNCGLFAKDSLTSSITAQIGIRILRDHQPEAFHSFAYDDCAHGVSYIHLGNGKVAKIDANSITCCHNGVDGVLFLDNQQPFDINFGALPLDFQRGLEVKREDWLWKAVDAPFDQEGELMAQLYATAAIARYFPKLIPRQPCIQWIGEWGSGKTTSACYMPWLIQGDRFSMNSLGDKMEELEAALVDKPIVIFDNIDNVKEKKEEKQNLIAQTVTGGVKIPKRQLYKTMKLVEFQPKNPPILTAQSSPFLRPDVVSRSIFFTVSQAAQRPEMKQRTDEDFREEFFAVRNQIMAEVLVRIRNIHRALAVTEDREYTLQFRLRGFEKLAYSIADHEGWLEKAYRMMTLAKGNQEAEKTESDINIALTLYIGAYQNWAGRKVNATTLCKYLADLCRHADVNFIWKGNPTWLGKTLKCDRTSLGKKYGLVVEDPREGNPESKTKQACTYCFQPTREVTEQCAAEALQMLGASITNYYTVGKDLDFDDD